MDPRDLIITYQAGLIKKLQQQYQQNLNNLRQYGFILSFDEPALVNISVPGVIKRVTLHIDRRSEYDTGTEWVVDESIIANHHEIFDMIDDGRARSIRDFNGFVIKLTPTKDINFYIRGTLTKYISYSSTDDESDEPEPEPEMGIRWVLDLRFSKVYTIDYEFVLDTIREARERGIFKYSPKSYLLSQV